MNGGGFRNVVLEMMLGCAGDTRHGGNVNHARGKNFPRLRRCTEKWHKGGCHEEITAMGCYQLPCSIKLTVDTDPITFVL